MPSAFSHFLILEKLRQDYPISQEASKTMKDHPTAAYWGSVGPDFLFFYPADWNPIIKFLLETFHDLQNSLKDVSDLYSTTKNAFDNPADLISGGVYSELQYLASALSTTIKAKLATYATNSFDVFEFAKPPIHDPAGYQTQNIENWWWMDVAHHLHTGDYARNLWDGSRNSGLLRSYTYGYLSHVGSDVVGHGMVNTIVGGPYRNHWRRHTFVEKGIDVHLWDRVTGRSLSDSGAFQRIHFDNAPYSYPHMPDELASFISSTMSRTYSHLNIKSGIPSEDDIRLMYSYFYGWAKAATTNSSLNLPPVPDFDWWDMPEAIRNQIDQVGPPPTVTEPPLSDLNNFLKWKTFFTSIFKFIVWAIDAVTTILMLPVYVVARLATTPLRYLIWLLLKAIYELYESSRLSLALSGLMHPERHHLHLYENVLFPKWNDLSEFGYPYERYFNGKQTYHLVHPRSTMTPHEDTPTRSLFTPAKDETLKNLLLHDFGNNHAYQQMLECCRLAIANELPSLASTRSISAAEFSKYLFDDFEANDGSNIPNFNLDSDRGYGWPQWISTQSKPWTQYSQFRFPTCEK